MTDNVGVSSGAEAETHSGRRRWIGLGVLAGALSMIVLDGTIVGVALPVLIDELQLDLSDAQWVNGIYSVVFAALLLTAGRLGDRLGRRRMLVVGILVFMAGSLLAALSGTAGSLILARVVQGVGGALILPTTLSTVNATFRGRDRAVAFGVWGAVISGMAAFGPLLGGWLTTAFSWQWIFIVNLPIGAILLVGALLTVDETRAVITARGLDVDGLLLSVIGFGGLVFAMIEGRSLGWWAPIADFKVFGWVWPQTAPLSPVPIAGIIGIIGIVLFILWERRRAKNGRSAILDLQLFTVPTFTWGNLTALCVAIGEFGLLFVLPLFIVNAMGLTTLGAGLVLAAMGVGAFLSGASARHLSERMGAPNVVLLGLGIEVVGVALTALLLGAGISPWILAIVLVIYGVGLGLASAQLTGTVLADIPPDESGQGSATQSTVRQIGSALGTALIGAVLAAGLATALPARMDAVAGLPSESASQIVEATELSAGGTIAQIRGEGTTGKLGESGPAVAQALSDGLADASRVALFSAGGFLLLGFGAALQLRARARRSAN
ncbi:MULTISPECIES: DHA2 family efflux MFS transporter permease subunit [unclassified Leucobacter]|uniref:DHA2 family efflux MFS transporter permease subunit n=1 Tax=unclassified Leucobacter TaxID=2621730 RepID=UPI00165D5FB8|nr:MULTISPECIES: DHA2 family efflux MFS transporter permease subunit [unclassified Leucobacter]MBC9935956.1 DHA2 family efflux MFS transporter permease subunit [Leucobacter sp. cx-87]